MTADPEELATYRYELPQELIAQHPPPRRDDARLMLLPRRAGAVAHHGIRDLPLLLEPGDLLVVNDTRVLAARVALERASGGRVPGLLLEEPRTPEFQMMLEGRGRLRVGERLRVPGGALLVLAEDLGAGFWSVRLDDAGGRRTLREAGRMPLPPYIRRARGTAPDADDALDRERYQTVFAERPGAVAAPTAGLHFTAELIRALEQRGIELARVTLHVGPGTFLPVRAERVVDHRMHAEEYDVPAATSARVAAARARGGRVVAVGTTVVRTLEAASQGGELRAGSGRTDLFLRPPAAIGAVDALLTNFHLPESTLLMLVAAFAGTERVLGAYHEAVERGYRFFSYGDAMLIL